MEEEFGCGKSILYSTNQAFAQKNGDKTLAGTFS
jgi:hypothetical protein